MMDKSPLEKGAPLADRLEFWVRRFFERVGGALDFALRRATGPPSRTDLTALIPPIERAIEEKLRRAGDRILAPNLIELCYDYETYSQIGQKRLEFLQRELYSTVYEYIYNRRYQTLGEVNVKIGFDVFTRRLKIKALFPDETKAPAASPEVETRPEAKACEIALCLKSGIRLGKLRAQLTSAGDRVSVGRSHDNRIVIEDSTVSNFHAAFTLAPNGALWLTDLGSSNGTFVNGVPLAAGNKSIVRPGDRLQFGDIEATLEVRMKEESGK
jgi:hypothetical protein